MSCVTIKYNETLDKEFRDFLRKNELKPLFQDIYMDNKYPKSILIDNETYWFVFVGKEKNSENLYKVYFKKGDPSPERSPDYYIYSVVSDTLLIQNENWYYIIQ
jgi:hypothetical protein